VSARKCPICGKPVDPAHRPFCSRRCADIDLQRWLSGRYVVPASEEDEEARRVVEDDDSTGQN